MKHTRVARVVVILTGVFSALFTVSCSGWERKAVFRGSSSHIAVEIQQPFPANGWGIRVLLITDEGTPTTLYELRGDVFLDFADVAWSQNDTAVAIFTCGTPPIRLGYSPAEHKFIPFNELRSVTAEHIRREYAADKQGISDSDILSWACSTGGKDAFLRLHPDASPR